MAQYANLKADIVAAIYNNSNQEITGAVLQGILTQIVDTVGADYIYVGVATPTTNPGTIDQRVFYIASQAGTYTNFGGIVVAEDDGVVILKYNSSWTKETTGIVSAAQLNQLGHEIYEYVGKIEPNFQIGGINSDGSYPATANNRAYSKAIQAPFRIEMNTGYEIYNIFKYTAADAATGSAVGKESTAYFEAGDTSFYRLQVRKSNNSNFAAADLPLITKSCLSGISLNERLLENIDSMPQTGGLGLVYSGGVAEAIHRLFDNEYDVADSGFLNAWGFVTTHAGYVHSGYIPVKPGDQFVLVYSCTGQAVDLWLSAPNVILSTFQHTAGQTVTAPAGAKFLRVSCSTGTATKIKRVSTGRSFADLDVFDREIGSLKNGIVSGQIATPSDFTISAYIRASDGAEVSYALSRATDFIPVLPNTRYIGYILATNNTTTANIAQYKADKTFVSGSGNLVDLIDITTGADTYFIRCSSRQESVNYAVLRIARALNATYQPQIPKLYPKANLPVIAFSFDGTYYKDSQIVALFDSYGVRCNFAVRYSVAAQKYPYYGDLQKRGYDICAHGGEKFTEDEGWTPSTAGAKFNEMKTTLEKVGFQISGMIAPRSVMDMAFVPECEKVFAYCFANGNDNSRSANRCHLSRYSMESHTTADIKSYIDSCISNDEICVLYGHSENFDAINSSSGEMWDIDKVEELLQYAIAKRDARLVYLDSLDNVVKYFFGL